jgi:integrase/recombinase XerD
MLSSTSIKVSSVKVGDGDEVGDNSPPEADNEPRDPGLAGTNPLGDGDDAVRRRRGRKRKARSVGRYPFLTVSKAYLRDLRPFRAELTLEQLRRDLGTIDRDLQALYAAGEVSAMYPPKLTEADVATLLLRWRTRPSRYGTPMDPTSQAHLFRALRGLLEWCGNGAISRMKARSHVRFPRTVEKPVEALGAEDLARIRAAADAISGWNGVVARLIVNLAVASGLRPKELRLAQLEDLDLPRGRIRVSHPKGEGAWAAQAYAPILGTAREAVREFLEERADYLSSRGFDVSKVEHLVPYVRKDGRVESWPEAMLRKLKGELERVSGVRFHLKTFRATFAQLAKDNGASIEAVSRALRHASTKTTEAYYARIRGEAAFRELETAWERMGQFPSD